MKEKKRKAPPVNTGYDPRAVERAPKFADGHLPTDESSIFCHSEPVTDVTGVGIRNSPVGADDSVRPQDNISTSSPVGADAHIRPENSNTASPAKAPDGISGDWQ